MRSNFSLSLSPTLMLLGSPHHVTCYVVCPLPAHTFDEQLTEKVTVVNILLDLRFIYFLLIADTYRQFLKIQGQVTDP